MGSTQGIPSLNCNSIHILCILSTSIFCFKEKIIINFSSMAQSLVKLRGVQHPTLIHSFEIFYHSVKRVTQILKDLVQCFREQRKTDKNDQEWISSQDPSPGQAGNTQHCSLPWSSPQCYPEAKKSHNMDKCTGRYPTGVKAGSRKVLLGR